MGKLRYHTCLSCAECTGYQRNMTKVVYMLAEQKEKRSVTCEDMPLVWRRIQVQLILHLHGVLELLRRLLRHHVLLRMLWDMLLWMAHAH